MSKNQVQELLQRIVGGDSFALIEATTMVNNPEVKESVVDELIDGLDFASFLYSLGTNDEQDVQEFQKIVENFQQLQRHESDLDSGRCRLKQYVFEQAVLDRLLETTLEETLRLRVAKEREEITYTMDFCEQDIATEEDHVIFYSTWIKEAKKHLHHPRFTSLPEDVFDELVEAVAAELESEDDEE